MKRSLLFLFLFAIVSPAWVESVEFPWNVYPKPLWERELVWLKNIGITHISLPSAQNADDLKDVIQIIRRLNIEADLEGPVPESLAALKSDHGGPLTEPLPGPPVRISILAPTAVTRSRELLASGSAAVLWTDVEETLGPAGYRPGATTFTGDEKSAAAALRRAAQLAAYWNKTFPSLHPIAGAGIVVPGTTPAKPAAPGPIVRQFAGEHGVSVISLVNKSAHQWTGEMKVLDPASKRMLSIAGVSVPARDALWLPVGVPLTAGPLCRNCTAFANGEHLVYATAELTAIEYENGVLAMEFSAPQPGEAVLQLSREPSGPLVAGGKLAPFDWDEHTQLVKLKIPAGKDPGNHVRIGIAIEAPDATAFFDNAHVLVIGETNSLTAQFSSEAIAQRSRLRTFPELMLDQAPPKEPLSLTYLIKVPPTFIDSDHADLAIEADGVQMSHVHPQLLTPVRLSFPDAVDVHVAANSTLPLFPATIPVSQRAGREFTVTIRNNAPEIRNFTLEPKVDGLEFSPAKMDAAVGMSTSRDVTFRIFGTRAMPGLRAGTIGISGAASADEPIQFIVIPQTGEVAFTTSGFSFLESAKTRATFMPGRWLEFLNKDNNQNQLPATGVAFTPGPIEARTDSLVFQDQRALKLEDLEQLAQKTKSASDAHR